MNTIKLQMTNWKIEDKLPYINLGQSGDNNSTRIIIKTSDLIQDENSNNMVGYFLDIYDSNSTVTYAFEALEVDNDTLTCTCSEEFLGSTGVKLLMVRCNILDSNLQEIAQYTSNFIHAIVDKGASVSSEGLIHQPFYYTLNKAIKDNQSKIKQITEKSDENIKQAIDNYLVKHPIDSTINKRDVQNIVHDYMATNKNEFKGEKGDKGDTGAKGDNGTNGKSAYQIAIDNGFTGTETEWLASLKGEKGDKGSGTDGNIDIEFHEVDTQELINYYHSCINGGEQ